MTQLDKSDWLAGIVPLQIFSVSDLDLPACARRRWLAALGLPTRTSFKRAELSQVAGVPTLQPAEAALAEASAFKVKKFEWACARGPGQRRRTQPRR